MILETGKLNAKGSIEYKFKCICVKLVSVSSLREGFKKKPIESVIMIIASGGGGGGPGGG